MDNERIAGRAAFGAEDPAAGCCVKRIGGEAIDRFGRHGHQSAAPQHAREPAQVGQGAAMDMGRHAAGS
jgi:hypothetical protein